MSLFEEICSYNNLLLAFDRVEENAGCPGVDNITIEGFSIGLEERLLSLRKELLSGSYEPAALLKVSILKDSGKIRWLLIPTVRDRIVQTSAAMVLDPILDREFEKCSFAYRKGLSVQKAVQKIIELRDKGYIWVVDADITLFFDEIDHEILIGELKKHVDDEKVINLIRIWLKVDVMYKGERTRLTKGVPQGSPISPLLSNLYLDTFDEALMEAKQKHVRFADDFVILCKDKPDAEDALELTEDVLKMLKLNLNPEKTRLTHFNYGFKFLGVEFIRTMAFKPVYEEKTEIEKETLPVTQAIVTPSKVEEKRRLDVPDTLMAQAFRKAIDEAGQEDFDAMIGERPDIEPSAFGEPFMRTLYLMEQGIVLSKEDERFNIRKEGEVIKEIPAIKVDQIIVFGNIQITTQAMKFCLQEDIPIILLSSRGKYFGAVDSFKGSNVLLHKIQFEMADDRAASLQIAKEIVRAKINNSKVLIQRYGRKRQHLKLDLHVEKMNLLLDRVPLAASHEELMGIEGAASASYFSGVRILIGDVWGFRERRKQPPPDPVNSLLSYGYTLLFHNIYAMVRMHRLHPYVGFLHGIRDGHPALVSDILEEFRAPVVDSTVMNLLIRGSLKKNDFQMPEDEGSPCLLKGDARKVFIRAFEGKMNSPVSHSPSGYHVDYRRCIDLQAQALKKVIEGKLKKYEPMTIK
ncbi:MAG: CRISPR-associated endonuclease Cas1 [Nitrospirota bacterium]